MIQRMDTSVDTKTCVKCGRVLPATEFASKTLGPMSECVECAWERMCQIPKADLDRIPRHYRRYWGENREKILMRMRRRFASAVSPPVENCTHTAG